MKQKKRTFSRAGFLLLAVILLVIVLSIGSAVSARPGLVPASAPQAATLPAETCVYDGLSNTRSCELWAVAGTVDLPGWLGMPIWGYTDTDPLLGGTAQIPGPAIIANQGETVEVTLHNEIGETTSLIFPGQAMMPDQTGVLDGSSTSYSFVASKPGTYLYEAGPLANAQHQVAMGMYGSLVVRPSASNQAYDDLATAFDDEALIVLSEIDPDLNTLADPSTFDMRDYDPRFWLINGTAYPDTIAINSMPGNSVLLRYINAGVDQHSMGTLGVDQTIVATNGNPLSYSFRVAAASLGSGETSDRMLTMPNPAPAGGAKFAVYDTSLLLHNNGAPGFGGMLTFIEVTDGTPPATGPTTSAVALAPNPTDGTADVTLNATISGALTITGAEYFVGSPGASGGGTPMSASDGAFDSTSEAVEATITVADLASLSSGNHTFYVHGSDGTWGAFNFAVLSLDKLGPVTSGTTLAPNPSNGSVSVVLSATGNDSATGNNNIAAAEYFINVIGADGTGEPMSVNIVAPIASLLATIPSGLIEGDHIVYVHSMDDFGWWGGFDSVTLVVDQTGPTTGNVVANPNPNNGATPYSPTVYALRVDAEISDGSSTIMGAEGFIGTVGSDGSGFPLTPRDGLFNELFEEAYVYIPLSTISALGEGTHPIWIHGQDASGNWGAAVAVSLIIDQTAPSVSNVSASPNPTGATTLVALTADAADSASPIATAEWFDGPDPGPGNGTPMQAQDGAFDSLAEALTSALDVSAWTPGDHTISVRARDQAGNWSAVETMVLCVDKCNDIFADSFASGDTSAWSATTGSVSVIGLAAMDGDGNGLAADISGGAAEYVTNITDPAGDETSYHARFYFNPNSALSDNNQPITLLDGQNAGGTSIFGVEYRRRNAQGGSYQVRGVVQTAGGTETTGWVNINNGSANAIEIAWESGAAASFSLYVHGGLQETLAGLDTSANQLDAIHLGPSGGSGLAGSASGTVYLDDFVSTRYTVIGP